VVNALTGAAIGAGTKLIIDKITGKPTVVKTGSTGSNTSGGTKPPVGGTPKPPTGGTPKPPSGSTAKPPAGGATPPVAPKSGSGSPTSVIKNPATGLPTGTGFGDEKEEFTTDSLGNTYKTMPDGTSVLYRAAEVEDDFPTTNVGDDSTTSESQYFQDEDGNIYMMNSDGGYDLYRAAEVDEDFSEEPVVEEEQYYDDGEGNTYILNDSGEYELYRAAEVPEDILEEDYDLFNRGNEDYTPVEDDNYYDYGSSDDDPYYDYGDDYPDIKRGGLITMMKKGGVPRFEDGGYSETDEEVQPWQNVNYNYGEEDDPTMTGYTLTGNRNPVGNTYERNVASDDGDDFTPVPGRQYFDDGSYIDTFDDGSTMTYDYDGNLVDTSEAYQTTRDDEGNYIVTDGFGNMTVYDPSGNLIPLGGGRVNAGPITNVGSGTRTPTPSTPRNPDAPPAPTGIGSDLLNTITGALGTTAGAAGAGALIASLLGSDFGGGTGNQNQGLDMSQVGVINPRTTDFGIGPTNFVSYEDYGTSDGDYTPNAELLKNLNAPGYNPVNEGDYGYEEVEEEVPQMASGGLSSMATPVASYYTFGQPADILANLGMRAQPPMNPPESMPQIGQQKPPQQMQQQGLPQQMPPQMAQQVPQGMPQQGMMPQQQGMPPPMRKGGLPHVSNVPMVEGRMDFRKGAAVHGAGDGQSDDIPAMLADGEYVIDAETVAQIGNGSTKAGAQALDKFRESIRAHKRSAPVNKIPPKTKALTSYLKGAK